MRFTAEHLSVRLGKTTILQDVTLSAKAGEVLVLIGPNGAGKSTFLRAAAGILRPQTGEIRLEGTDLAGLAPRERAKRIGLVPQEHRIRHPFSVHEIVKMGRYPYQGALGAAHRDDHKRIQHAMHAAHIGPLAHRNVATLSGGERQRVLIARVLAQDPEVYLFDEPTASLDLAQSHHVQRLLNQLAGYGKSVIVVIHDLEQASRIADRVVLMARGRVIAHGTPRDVIAPIPIREAYGVNVDVEWSGADTEGARVRVREEPHSA